MPKWEYKTIEISAEYTSKNSLFISENDQELSNKTIPDLKNKLDVLGSDGWELVGVFLETETSHPNFGNTQYVSGLQPNIRPKKLVCMFKRQSNFW